MEHFLDRIKDLSYHFVSAEDCEETICTEDPDPALTDLPYHYTQADLMKQVQSVETFERLQDTNQLIESTFRLASNVTDLFETHKLLVVESHQLIDLTMHYFKQMVIH